MSLAVGDVLESHSGRWLYVEGIEGLLEPGESRPKGSLWHVIEVGGKASGTRYGMPACDLETWTTVASCGASKA